MLDVKSYGWERFGQGILEQFVVTRLYFPLYKCYLMWDWSKPCNSCSLNHCSPGVLSVPGRVTAHPVTCPDLQGVEIFLLTRHSPGQASPIPWKGDFVPPMGCVWGKTRCWWATQVHVPSKEELSANQSSWPWDALGKAAGPPLPRAGKHWAHWDGQNVWLCQTLPLWLSERF